MTTRNEIVLLPVRVQPNARQESIGAWMGEQLKISVRAAPEDGKANRAVERVLERALRPAKSRALVVRGHASRSK